MFKIYSYCLLFCLLLKFFNEFTFEIGLKSIFEDGDQNNIMDKMQTRKRLYDLVEYEKYNTPGKKITDFSTEGHE